MKKRRLSHFRILRYLVLAILPLIVLWVLIIHQSHEWAISITEHNAQNIVEKNAEIIDQQISSLSQSLYLFMNDAIVNELLADSDYSNPLQRIANNRELTDIIGQYFYSQEYILNIYIVSSNYSNGFFNITGLPDIISLDYICNLQEIYNSQSAALWFPVQKCNQYISIDENYDRYYGDFDVVVLGALMNLSYVKYGYVHTFSDVSEQPVILVLINPAIFEQWLETEQLLSSSTSYRIYDQENQLFYASENNDATLEQPFTNGLDIQVKYATDSEGRQVLLCSRMLKETHWIITSYTVIDNTFAYFGNNISLISSIVIIATLIIIILAFIISNRSISHPLDLLSSALQKTAKGEYDYRITSTRYPEYQDTFDTYNSMNQQIAELIRENYDVKLSEKNLEIQLINMQFNPHFLYNTLNIVSLIALENNQDQISDILSKLSFMMRYSVKSTDTKVPLREDLTYINSYISLMQLRSNHKFAFEKDIDESLMDQLVPKFILQPFVENAILHGFTDNLQHYSLCVTGKRRGDDIVFTVQDNGQGVEADKILAMRDEKTTGIGIQNTNNRIQLYYGSNYGVHINSKLGVGTVVTITIPWKV